MNVLILAAGPQALEDRAAYPVWLSEIDGRLVMERLVASLSIKDSSNFIFALTKADIDEHHVNDIVTQISPNSTIIPIERQTAGAACTALLAIGALDLESELIVASATDYVEADYSTIIQSFRDQKADVGLVTFESLHPRYAYVAVDEKGWVVEAAEKRPISRRASAGFYWYAKASDFVSSLQDMILKDAHVNGVFYISPSLNELVLAGRRISGYHLEHDQYHPLKDQRQVDQMGYRS
ncbi:MAG: glycosyltransferase family 2 protein [Candidatus Brevundimonas colombiensis]|uniref:Glycosyltransferase family 2 protein n=1 Tax=Candidatus Brevundimonas colombiensis TaxID=3121376 RepID=A0AAJ5WYY0_9CAUL|nr:glycosyltransferase family 2 protein [Brevundimonas sp.]WEK40946.1 MAG: glycosyltransferase family 2 protein [Brevundimonas sp.]